MVLDFNTLYHFPTRFDRMFEELAKPWQGTRHRMAYPPLNLSADEDNIYVRAEVPGLDMEDIDLTLTDKTLVLKGERKGEEGRYYRQERPVGHFHRVVNLNVPVDRDNVTAVLVDGILTVTLSKAEEIKPRKIAIEIA